MRQSTSRDNGATVFKTKVSCEDVGVTIAATCLELLEKTVPQWVEEAEKALAELNSDTAGNLQEREKFQLELSALVFVLFRIAIEFLGPDDTTKRSRIFEVFDRITGQALNQQFLELTGRRAPCYGKCIQENLGGEYLNFRLITRFEYFEEIDNRESFHLRIGNSRRNGPSEFRLAANRAIWEIVLFWPLPNGFIMRSLHVTSG